MEPDLVESACRIAVALAVGLLIGIERGWKARDTEEGARKIGIRTLAVTGLLGGSTGLLSGQFGGLLIGLAFLGLSVLLGLVYTIKEDTRSDLGLTTEVATLATFVLGVLAGVGHLALASAGAVILSIVLGYKSSLHIWLQALQPEELAAGFKLLLLSVVLLPLLPDRGFGPWEALNPYVIWWMVVMIAAISFVGYFAIRISGPRAGIVFTALFGGLASSTATTLNLSRLARQKDSGRSLLAGGILVACGTMFPRMLLLGTVIHPPVFAYLAGPALAMAVITYGPALWLLRRAGTEATSDKLLPRNPLELIPALSFGALLALVMVLGQALTAWFGDVGVLALAAASGVADVDAITLSLAQMSGHDLTVSVAVMGIVIAAGVNSLIKGGMAFAIGGRDLGLRVLPTLAAAVAGGMAVILIARYHAG